MELFEQIREFTCRSVKENDKNTALIHNWKRDIRNTLITVKQNFIEWIDNFTDKFVKNLNKIEQSRELVEFANEDKKLTL